MTTRQRLERCRTHLVLDAPFWGALSLNLDLVEDLTADTAMVNGKALRYNPAFIGTLTDPQLKGLLAHEVAHCAMGHFWRGDGRDAREWNICCDLEINPHLVASGFILPEGALTDSTYQDMSAEQIYNARQQKQDDDAQQQQPAGAPGSAGQQQDNGQADPNGQQDGQAGPGNGTDPGQCGGVEPAPADATDDAGNDMADRWKVATVQAARAAKMRGDLPGMGARLLDELTRPSLPWQTILADFVQRTARNDYTWKRPHRNYLQCGLFVPTLHNNELGEVVIAIDTSGSVDGPILSAFCQAVSDILGAYNTRAHVLFCDAAIQDHVEYESADLPIEPKPAGGGGTDFRPVFDWIEQRDLDPACLIYLTDLEGDFPDVEPDYPTVWAVVGDARPPWGELVEMPERL